MNRLVKIKKLKKKGLTLGNIGKIMNPPITMERVRQILDETNKNYKVCRLHNEKFIEGGKCYMCFLKSAYKKALKNWEFLESEIERLKDSDRKKMSVLKKSLIVKELKDVHKYSILAISRMFGFHHSSIGNLYNKRV